MRKEIPILFSTPMVEALLAGRKTQTRRIIKPPFEFIGASRYLSKPDKSERFIPYDCPYGQPGDLLWVRETWCNAIEEKEEYLYRATHEAFNDEGGSPWKPSIHMPKAAARIWHEVTGIRVERIADISEEDCIAEGIHLQETGFYCWEPDLGLQFSARSAKEAFRKLWKLINGQPRPVQEKINGKIVTVAYEVYPFNEEDGKEFIGLTEWKGKPLTVCINPWVWVVEFKVLSTTGKPKI